jgi:hypothetical protein
MRQNYFSSKEKPKELEVVKFLPHTWVSAGGAARYLSSLDLGGGGKLNFHKGFYITFQ